MRRHRHRDQPDEASADLPEEAGRGEDTSPTAAAAGEGGEDSTADPRITELERQVETEHTLYLRTLADFQNYRRRQEEENRQNRQFANREMILALLPILDNFERALSAAEQSNSYEALVGGVALTLRQMQDFLKKNGVEAIEAVGREFDPNFHEAVMRVEDEQHPENTVVEELQRGYAMHDRVLRPSMVKVAAKP